MTGLAYQGAGRCPTPQKIRYGTRDLAKDELRAATARGADTAGNRAYKCPCGFFHTTSRSAEYRARIRQYDADLATPPESP